MALSKVFVVDGGRTPFLKARGEPGPFSASDLAVGCARPVLARQPFGPEQIDEVIVVLEGTLEVRLGDEKLIVGPDHTISIPMKTPHAFKVVSPEGARIITFMPKQGVFMGGTVYLEGEPPLGGNLK